MGFLGSTLAKVRMAYLLGLITYQEQEIMKRLAEIRNYFAHHPNAGYEVQYVYVQVQEIAKFYRQIYAPPHYEDEITIELLSMEMDVATASNPSSALWLFRTVLFALTLRGVFALHSIEHLTHLQETEEGSVAAVDYLRDGFVRDQGKKLFDTLGFKGLIGHAEPCERLGSSANDLSKMG
jgi:hypothetical protein